jgi:hypothetical protein
MVIRTCGKDCEFHNTDDRHLVIPCCALYGFVNLRCYQGEPSFDEGHSCAFSLENNSELPKDELGLAKVLNSASGLFKRSLSSKDFSFAAYQSFIIAEDEV